MTVKPVLVIKNVKKKFSRTLKSSALNGFRDIANDLFRRTAPRDHLRAGEFWALNDVSFDVRKGEAVWDHRGQWFRQIYTPEAYLRHLSA